MKNTDIRLEIRPADIQEISALTAMAKAAFDEEIRLHNPGAEPPYAYDDKRWYMDMLIENHLYSVLESGGEARLVGGAVIFAVPGEHGAMYLGRVFIDPAMQNRGCGSKALLLLEAMFPDFDTWRLDTPVWDSKTNHFYQKLGYKNVKRDGFLAYYQKKLAR